ncbi:hypothetical protein [Comamonas sp.]|uniref:hypothetical protein n=1 Tax=Comamonas sp. TaxID=34028 RepID=UPI003A956949
MSKALLTNQKLMEVLGLNGLSIVSLDIACRVNEFPRVTAIIHPRKSPDHVHVQQFQLIAVDAPAPNLPSSDEGQPFDLDAMCAAARQRIKDHIDQSTDKHLMEMTALDDEFRSYELTNFVEGGFVGGLNGSVEAIIRSINSGGHLAAALERTYGLQRRGQ